jgi:hypothetical protein
LGGDYHRDNNLSIAVDAGFSTSVGNQIVYFTNTKIEKYAYRTMDQKLTTLPNVANEFATSPS